MQKKQYQIKCLTKVSGYMNPYKIRLFMKTLFSSYFPHCSPNMDVSQ